MKSIRYLPFWCSVLLISSFVTSEPALALQVHPSPEGLYAHQIGHLFFICSMAILAFWLRKTALVRRKGWRYIQIGCLWFIAWNIDAILGHHMESMLTEDSFVGKGWGRTLMADRVLFPYLYYFLKMDHFFCVPAIVFLFLGVKTLLRETEER